MADTTDVAAMTVVVQRVRVRWSKEGRGAREATRRAELGRAFPHPASPPGTPLVHDVLIDTEGAFGSRSGRRPRRRTCASC